MPLSRRLYPISSFFSIAGYIVPSIKISPTYSEMRFGVTTLRGDKACEAVHLKSIDTEEESDWKTDH